MLLIATLPVLSSEYRVTVDEVISVYDGDTFRVNLQNLHPLLGSNIPIRVRGIDTPEIRGKCKAEKKLAIKAREYTRQLLANAKVIELRNLERGKYFRLVADVYIDGKPLSTLLIDSNLASSYSNTAPKQEWCNKLDS